MELVKAIPIGAIITLAVALVIGSQGSTGGYLEIHRMPQISQEIYWSWPLFLAATGVAWGMMALQR